MTIKNLAASVHARLHNQAKQTQRRFNEVLQYFAMERFLYRLSQSEHRARFKLKGALMLHVWNAPQARATSDLDFLGRTDNSLDNLVSVVREICVTAVGGYSLGVARDSNNPGTSRAAGSAVALGTTP